MGVFVNNNSSWYVFTVAYKENLLFIASIKQKEQTR